MKFQSFAKTQESAFATNEFFPKTQILSKLVFLEKKAGRELPFASALPSGAPRRELPLLRCSSPALRKREAIGRHRASLRPSLHSSATRRTFGAEEARATQFGMIDR